VDHLDGEQLSIHNHPQHVYTGLQLWQIIQQNSRVAHEVKCTPVAELAIKTVKQNALILVSDDRDVNDLEAELASQLFKPCLNQPKNKSGFQSLKAALGLGRDD